MIVALPGLFSYLFFCSNHFLFVIHPSIRLSVHLLALSNENFSEANEVICLSLGKDVAWVGGFKNS